jgi:hypothetical protein
MTIKTLNNKLSLGENEVIIISNNAIRSDVNVILVCNKQKSIADFKVEDNIIKVYINVTDSKKYSILIKNGNETYISELICDIPKEEKHYHFNSSLDYSNGLITMTISTNQIITEDYNINIAGDLTRSITWEKGERYLVLNFIRMVKDYSLLRYSINSQMFGSYVINREIFPDKFIRIANGLKLNKSCEYGLSLCVGDEHIEIAPNQRDVHYTWDYTKTFRLMFNNVEIFTQTILNKAVKPELVIVDNPLRLKLGYPTLERVEVKIKQIPHVIVIDAGDTEKEFEIVQDKRCVEIEIVNASNVIVNQTIWQFPYR